MQPILFAIYKLQSITSIKASSKYALLKRNSFQIINNLIPISSFIITFNTLKIRRVI